MYYIYMFVLSVTNIMINMHAPVRLHILLCAKMCWYICPTAQLRKLTCAVRLRAIHSFCYVLRADFLSRFQQVVHSALACRMLLQLRKCSKQTICGDDFKGYGSAFAPNISTFVSRQQQQPKMMLPALMVLMIPRLDQLCLSMESMCDNRGYFVCVLILSTTEFILNYQCMVSEPSNISDIWYHCDNAIEYRCVWFRNLYSYHSFQFYMYRSGWDDERKNVVRKPTGIERG